MLCKKHQVEEYNSSDCESCNLEIRIKQLEAQIKQMKKDYPFFDDGDSGNYTLEDGKPLEDK
jgi:hypothetical protein